MKEKSRYAGGLHLPSSRVVHSPVLTLQILLVHPGLWRRPLTGLLEDGTRTDPGTFLDEGTLPAKSLGLAVRLTPGIPQQNGVLRFNVDHWILRQPCLFLQLAAALHN